MIKINKINFFPNKLCNYKNDYVKIYNHLLSINNIEEEKAYWRKLILSDLFFIVYFVLRIKIANTPFVVEKCKLLEKGPLTNTLDIWARFHFKSTIITIAETIQYHLLYPDRCSCIFSYKKAAAENFVNGIRRAYESKFLKECFPDILYQNPSAESPSWNNDSGICLKRPNRSRPQKTVQSSGIIEGMLYGSHFERRIYDDALETHDIQNNQHLLEKSFEKFEMSHNLCTGTPYDSHRVVGTFYSHLGAYTKIKNMKDSDDNLLYNTRIIPATDDGSEDGNPVLVSRKMLNSLKKNKFFYSQQLCDPTPKHDIALDSSLLKRISQEELPKKMFKFMLIDPAGDKHTNKGSMDSWAIQIIGVEPEIDNVGSSNIYLLDSFIDKLGETESIILLTQMYNRNQIIDQVGYERLGNITPAWLFHFQNTLHANGVLLSEQSKNLVILKHKNREKKHRITQSLQMPLLNGKIHYVDTINEKYIDRLKSEMNTHPLGRDDGIDALAYIYDVLDDFGFKYKITRPVSKIKHKKRDIHSYGWLAV